MKNKNFVYFISPKCTTHNMLSATSLNVHFKIFFQGGRFLKGFSFAKNASPILRLIKHSLSNVKKMFLNIKSLFSILWHIQHIMAYLAYLLQHFSMFFSTFYMKKVINKTALWSVICFIKYVLLVYKNIYCNRQTFVFNLYLRVNKKILLFQLGLVGGEGI